MLQVWTPSPIWTAWTRLVGPNYHLIILPCRDPLYLSDDDYTHFRIVVNKAASIVHSATGSFAYLHDGRQTLHTSSETLPIWSYILSSNLAWFACRKYYDLLNEDDALRTVQNDELFRVPWNERLKHCCRLVKSTTYLSSGLRWSRLIHRLTPIAEVTGFEFSRVHSIFLFRGFGRGNIVNIALSTWFCEYGLTCVGVWISRLFEHIFWRSRRWWVSLCTLGSYHGLPFGRATRGWIVNITHSKY
jgi:hypothetical protein